MLKAIKYLKEITFFSDCLRGDFWDWQVIVEIFCWRWGYIHVENKRNRNETTNRYCTYNKNNILLP